MRAELGALAGSGDAEPLGAQSEEGGRTAKGLASLKVSELEREIETMRADLASLGVSVDSEQIARRSPGGPSLPSPPPQAPSYPPPPLPTHDSAQSALSTASSQARYLRHRLCGAVRSHYGAEVTLHALLARFGLGPEVLVDIAELGTLVSTHSYSPRLALLQPPSPNTRPLLAALSLRSKPCCPTRWTHRSYVYY